MEVGPTDLLWSFRGLVGDLRCQTRCPGQPGAVNAEGTSFASLVPSAIVLVGRIGLELTTR